MAERVVSEAVSEALAQFDEDAPTHGKVFRHARRAEAVTLAMAGLSYEKIGEELGISTSAAHALVTRTIAETRNYAVDHLRELENARLDRMTTAIWNKVIEGDLKAVDSYLRIAERRAKLNGLDAPTRVQMAVSVRVEMEEKLRELREVIDAEVVSEEDVAEAEERQAVEQYVNREVDVSLEGIEDE